MIHIIQHFTHTNREKRISLSLSQAKKFLYQLRKAGASVRSDFFVVSGDFAGEVEAITNYFSPKFLTTVQRGFFDVLRVEQDLPRAERLNNAGATPTALERFRLKIIKEIPDAEITFTYSEKMFEILLVRGQEKTKLLYNYALAPLAKLVYSDTAGRFVNIEGASGIALKINEIFRKQRYYYKKKGEEYDTYRKNLGK